jgi:IS1 family transposase
MTSKRPAANQTAQNAATKRRQRALRYNSYARTIDKILDSLHPERHSEHHTALLEATRLFRAAATDDVEAAQWLEDVSRDLNIRAQEKVRDA